MMNRAQHTCRAVQQVLGERTYVLTFLLLALFFFGFFVAIPTATIPGNDFTFQLSIFRPQDYLLMTLLALLVGLTASMNIYTWRKQKQVASVSQSAVSSAASGLGGAFAAIVGTAACASCLAYLFGIIGLGFGSVAFVLEYQTLFFIGALVLVILSLYFTARNIMKHCPSH